MNKGHTVNLKTHDKRVQCQCNQTACDHTGKVFLTLPSGLILSTNYQIEQRKRKDQRGHEQCVKLVPLFKRPVKFLVTPRRAAGVWLHL